MSGVLTPLSWIYGAAVRARLWWYAHGWGRVHTLGRPVISVGNLSAGGTGKTPVVIAIAEALLARGVGVAVLSRGYRGASERGGALVSDGRGGPALDWRAAGDEPALIAQRVPRAAVIVGRVRAAAWRRFGAGLPPGVVILDDGFQHVAIARDENVVLVDATDDVSGSALLPRGRLREPWSALSRATAVVITRVERAAPGAVESAERLVGRVAPGVPIARARFEPEALLDVATGRGLALDRLRGATVAAAAGIGRFESFAGLLDGLGARVIETMRYADHHAFSPGDVASVMARARAAGADAIVTTEKDAVKLRGLGEPELPMWAVRIRTRIEPDAWWGSLLDRMAARVAR